jgi:hypothetical protein
MFSFKEIILKMQTNKTQDGLMAHVIIFFKIMFEPMIWCCFHVFPASDSGSDLGIWICWHSFHGLPAYLETDCAHVEGTC